MEAYKKEFIEFMVDCQVLKFGDFVTKSGRKTPFFVNTGFYRTGAQLRRLGQYYAEAVNNKFGLDFDVLFGPAYKGIPLSVAATIAISEKYGQDIRYCSNRKEVKDHGDKGILLGSPINDGDRVVIIEDVTTAGTSIEETLPIIKAQGDVNPIGLVVWRLFWRASLARESCERQMTGTLSSLAMILSIRLMSETACVRLSFDQPWPLLLSISTYTLTADGKLVVYYGRFYKGKTIPLTDITDVELKRSSGFGGIMPSKYVLIHYEKKNLLSLVPVKPEEFINALVKRLEHRIEEE